MNLGLLLLPVLGGYLFLTGAYFKRYDTIRDSGYRLFFRSAAAGLVLAMAAHFLLVFLDRWFPSIRECWKPHLPSEYDDTAILSLVLGFMLPFLINLFHDREKMVKRAAEKKGSFIELLISDSRTRRKPIEVSLRNGKFYIGFVNSFSVESGVIRRDESDVALIPILSGYRDNDTKELRITTDYAPVIQEWLRENQSGSSGRDFRVVLPISEIISARIFHPDAVPLFRQANEPPPGPLDKG